jgi:Family of unknown function (DUF6049)
MLAAMRLHRGSRVARALIALVALCVAVPGAAGAAQDTEPPGFSLQLVAQPPWHTPEASLGVRVRVVNDSDADLEGFRIQVAAHDRLTSRSDLHVSFQGAAGLDAALITDDRGLEQTIPAGEGADIDLDMPVGDLLPVESIVEGGVYPLSIRLFDRTGFTLLAELTTHVLYYPDVPERPLRAVVVVALNDLPSRGPDGRFEAGDDGVVPLEAALVEGGWLADALDALIERTEPVRRRIPIERPRRSRRGPSRRFRTQVLPPLEVGLAPTPRLLEELADMADGYAREAGSETDRVAPTDAPALAAQRALDDLRELAGRDSVQMLLVPYANPDLPTLAAHGSSLLTHVDLGAEVVGERLGVNIDRNWLFPPAGRLDAAALEELGEADDAGNTFLDQAALDTPIDPSVVQCPEASPTFACAIRIEAGGQRSHAFLLDQDVDARFTDITRSGNDRLDLQNLLAETAMVHAELPGTLDRALHFVVPSTWHPRPHAWKLLMHALTRAPWLDTERPVDVLNSDLPVVDMDLDDQAPAVENAPDASFFDRIDTAAGLVDHLKSLGAPGSITTRLDNNLLVAQSRVWWVDRTLETRRDGFISESQEEADALFDKIELRGPDEITLTSRRGKIQLVVTNEGDFPVRLSVALRSLPLGGARLEPDELEVTVPEGTQRQLDIDAIAQTSGIFSLEADVKTTGDGYVIQTKRISVRSTRFNLIALGLTIGALLFLILFYATRAFRRAGPEEEAE